MTSSSDVQNAGLGVVHPNVAQGTAGRVDNDLVLMLIGTSPNLSGLALWFLSSPSGIERWALGSRHAVPVVLRGDGSTGAVTVERQSAESREENVRCDAVILFVYLNGDRSPDLSSW
jgi:hypothetical protein